MASKGKGNSLGPPALEAEKGNAMELQLHQVLRMNEGDGDTSYANNSSYQKQVMLKAKPILEESIKELLYSNEFLECIGFADLGCSSGPNTFLPIWEIVQAIDETCRRLNRKTPLLLVFLNDLPGNDFNSTFRSLPDFHKRLEAEKGSKFGPCFVYAAPGNFYGRLFPPKSLHFIHSSYSLQWCSKMPTISGNKDNIYLAKTSPPNVHKAYLNQFEKDFHLFLRCRAEEMVPKGRMVLTIYGREETTDSSNNYIPHSWELLGMVLNDMTYEGLMEESKLESFNVPFYGPSAEEVKRVIEVQGCFSINRFESFNIGWDASIGDGHIGDKVDKHTRGKYISNHARAIVEPILAAHFSVRTQLIDLIFQRFSVVVGDYLETAAGYYTSHVISLSKD